MVEGKGPNNYHHGDLRRALLQAALELVAEVGVQGFSLQEVARRAGVTHAAPYRHFASKETLVANLAEDGFHLMLRYMHQAQDGLPDEPLVRFQACGQGYLKFAVTYPSHFRLMFGANTVNREQYPSLMEAGQQAFSLLRDSVKACQAANQLRSGSSVELSLTAWSMLHGLASLWVDGQLHNLSQLGDLEACGHIVARVLLEGMQEPEASRSAVLPGRPSR